jgi:hypothetical protein
MKSTPILVATLVLPLGVGLFLAAAPAPAEARPEYANKEKKNCAFCHVNPKGGGPRTAKGDEYEKNGHKFLAPGFGENSAFTTEANGKAFDLVRKAIEIEHWADALKRLAELKSREKKGAGAQLVMNTEATVDGKGRDLLKAAKDAIVAGKVEEAADAVVRVETEFKGRDAAKDLSKVKADLAKLPGGADADKAARAKEPQRLLWLDALMKEAAGDVPGAVRLLNDLLAKYPGGPYATDAKTKHDALAPPPAGSPPGMM